MSALQTDLAAVPQPVSPPANQNDQRRTARMVAAYRGRASVWADPIVHDPWAMALAGFDGEQDADAYDLAHAHMELYVAVRTASFDADVARALDEGVKQVVILGAGYDTRAARLARPGVVFYEVDRPGTQRDKRARVAALDGYPVDAARYVECDFERQDFLGQLRAAGFETARRAVFVWEGVVYYLGEDAVRGTLHRISEACHPESRLLFDVVSKRFVAGDVSDEQDVAARERLAEMGEPLRFGVAAASPRSASSAWRKSLTARFRCIAIALDASWRR